jgi:DivIVA domain-containing protein
MELTPQLLTDEIDFRIAVRGYDRNEVDDFLERVAVAVGQLQTQMGKAVARAKAAEKRLAELSDGTAPAAPAAKLPTREPETELAVAPPPAAPAPISSDEDLNEELRRTLVLAQRTADSAIREANVEAESIVAASRAEAEQQREEARRRLVDEIAELEKVRETMRNDTVVLERYLGDERARVRETIQVLRRLVDDPASFSVGGAPELSGTTTPALDAPAPQPEPQRDVQPDPEPVTALEPGPEPASTPDATAAADPAPKPDPESASTSDAQPEDLGRLFEQSESSGSRDWRSADDARGDQGPHTQPVAAARFEEETDDAFLAELRRAMSDNEPLGPDGKS